MHGLKSGSCRFWHRTDLPPGSNMHGLKSGSCRFWHRTDLPPGSNMLRLAYADSGSACKLAGVQIIPLPTVANQILARTLSRSVAHQLASPAVGKFSRASSAGGRLNLQTNLFNRIVSVAEDCLSPERTFHGCSLMYFSCSIPSRISLRPQPLESSLGRVPQAADGTCNKISKTRSCRSPRTV